MARVAKPKSLAIRDRLLVERLRILADEIGEPAHLLLDRIVRAYLDETVTFEVCANCREPRPGVEPYARRHIVGSLCVTCRAGADYALNAAEARAAGLPVIEAPEPAMWGAR